MINAEQKQLVNIRVNSNHLPHLWTQATFRQSNPEYARRVPSISCYKSPPKIPFPCSASPLGRLPQEGVVAFALSKSQSPARWRAFALRSWSPCSLGLK